MHERDREAQNQQNQRRLARPHAIPMCAKCLPNKRCWPKARFGIAVLIRSTKTAGYSPWRFRKARSPIRRHQADSSRPDRDQRRFTLRQPDLDGRRRWEDLCGGETALARRGTDDEIVQRRQFATSNASARIKPSRTTVKTVLTIWARSFQFTALICQCKFFDQKR